MSARRVVTVVSLLCVALIPSIALGHQIHPAGDVRRDGSFTAKHLYSGQTLRKFEQLQQRVGTEAAYKTFAGLHPFVRANYGDKVVMMNVAHNTKTGGGGVADGMVTANEDLSSYLKGHGPAPAHVKAIVQASHGEAPSTHQPTPGHAAQTANHSLPFMYKTLDTLPPTSGAAHVLAGVSQALARDTRKLPSWKHFSEAVDAIAKLPGEFVRVEAKGAMVFQKNTPHGKADITYIPNDGIAIRVESYASQSGFAVAIRRGGREGTANIMSARLAPDHGPDPLRYVPQAGTRDVQAVQNAGKFVQVFGL